MSNIASGSKIQVVTNSDHSETKAIVPTDSLVSVKFKHENSHFVVIIRYLVVIFYCSSENLGGLFIFFVLLIV